MNNIITGFKISDIRPYKIGICGGTGTGKTTLSHNIVRDFSARRYSIGAIGRAAAKCFVKTNRSVYKPDLDFFAGLLNTGALIPDIESGELEQLGLYRLESLHLLKNHNVRSLTRDYLKRLICTPSGKKIHILEMHAVRSGWWNLDIIINLYCSQVTQALRKNISIEQAGFHNYIDRTNGGYPDSAIRLNTDMMGIEALHFTVGNILRARVI